MRLWSFKSNPVKQDEDQLITELKSRGITPDNDILFEVECQLALRGVDKNDVIYGANFYEVYMDNRNKSVE